jgi:hypothetical protein
LPKNAECQVTKHTNWECWQVDLCLATCSKRQVENSPKNLKKKATKIITLIQQYAQHLITSIQQYAQHLITSIQQYAQHIITSIQQYAQHLITSIQQYAQQLINHGHSSGHMEDVMDIIFATHKGKRLDTVEKYHIYHKTEKGI